MLSSAYISDHMKVRSQGPYHVRELCNKGFTTAAYVWCFLFFPGGGRRGRREIKDSVPERGKGEI
uniref:Uncharacterized protein n=1 Tax=Balaenoptera musculus TaxID=9771 RepID=A0A8C0D4E4_BALMU